MRQDSQQQKTRSLVTGGAGFIGSHLAAALVERGDEVIVFDNLSTGHLKNLSPLEGKLSFVKGDLLDREALRRVVSGVDVVYHQAALASVPRSVAAPLDTHAACVTGTLSLLDLARANGVRRVVYAGSSSAYGDQPYASKREADLPRPLSPYAAAKLAGEYYCMAFKFVTAMLCGNRPMIYGDGSQSRDFTYVDNLVQGLLAAASAPAAVGKVINVACGTQYSLLDLVSAINRLLGSNVQPMLSERRPGDVYSSLADITLAQKLLNYRPTIGFEEGLRRSIAYYRSLTQRS